jgi:CheY-like chemotaxis protein
MATILVVDDELVIRNSLRELLESRGLTMEAVSTGQEAIECAARHPPDLLIVDWMLGDDMDGLQLAETLRGAHHRLPTIVITGYSSNELQERVNRMSDTWLFHKPWSFDRFMQQVTDVLEAIPDD